MLVNVLIIVLTTVFGLMLLAMLAVAIAAFHSSQAAHYVKDLDRRWVFVLMFLSVAIPLLYELTFPEEPKALAIAVFDEIEALEAGDKVLMAWDYDPASEG